jgi:hypothetical protein
MKTLRQILRDTRSPEIKIVCDRAMAGAKYALMCGDTVYVSPAMHKLLSDDDGAEVLKITEAITVVPMVSAIATVREIDRPNGDRPEKAFTIKPDHLRV